VIVFGMVLLSVVLTLTTVKRSLHGVKGQFQIRARRLDSAQDGRRARAPLRVVLTPSEVVGAALVVSRGRPVANGECYAIVGWDELTHSDATRGAGGALPWHRCYSRLLDHEGYWNLSAGGRGLYHALLLVALRSAGKLPVDTLTITRKTGVKTSKRALDSLVDSCLIVFCASTVQAKRVQAASLARAELEVEREETVSGTVTGSKTTGAGHGGGSGDVNGAQPARTADDELSTLDPDELLRQRFGE